MLWYIFTGRDAGKEDVPLLAASVPECQEALSILLLRCGCGRSRHLVRCLLAAKGAAWLRPWLLCRILRASKHSSKAAARGGTSSLPAALCKCYLNKTSSVSKAAIRAWQFLLLAVFCKCCESKLDMVCFRLKWLVMIYLTIFSRKAYT